jgi:hypothetical protein
LFLLNPFVGEAARAFARAVSSRSFSREKSMNESIPPRQKRRRGETDRERAAKACAEHLEDLKQAHGIPPPDVKVPSRSAVRLVVPPPQGSFCTSPAQLCAELAE